MNLYHHILLLFLLYISSLDVANSRIKRRSHDDVELRRTKRTVYQALLKKQDRRNADDEGVDIDERSLINKPQSKKKPYVKQQVQDVKVRIEVIHEWRDEMTNKTSPEYELLAGNIIDAIANELTADLHYVSSGVSKLTKTKSKRKIIADVVIRFFKTEADPVSHIQGIINKGWISGQQIDPNYFKIIGVVNGNNEKPKWHYPDDVELRVVPAMIAPGSNSPSKSTPVSSNTTNTKKEKPTRFKEIKISIKLKQRYRMFLEDTNSPEFRELSGNVEQAIAKIFVHDALFIAAHVAELKESEEGRVIVKCSLQFKMEESYAIEKCQAMISSGDLAGMPVDEQYFVVNGMNQVGGANATQQNNTGSAVSGSTTPQNYLSAKAAQNNTDIQSQTNVESSKPKEAQASTNKLFKQNGSPTKIPDDIPQPQPMVKQFKPKPLKYKEIRVSLKLIQAWNASLANNLTKPYAMFSGIIEQAVDRALSANPHYIDTTVIDFLSSPEQLTIVNIAVRFHLEEEDPEGRLRNIIRDGTLSGIPVDNSFFFVFSLSETVQPAAFGDSRNQTKLEQPEQPVGGVSSTNKADENEIKVAEHRIQTTLAPLTSTAAGGQGNPAVSSGSATVGGPSSENVTTGGKNQQSSTPTVDGIGQKQPAEYKPNILTTAENLKPSSVGLSDNQSPAPNVTVPISPTRPTVSAAAVSATFNPYLPIETSSLPYQQTNQAQTTSQGTTPEAGKGYLDSSQGTVSSNAQDNIQPYDQNVQQSWYPTNEQEPDAYNPYKPAEALAQVSEAITSHIEQLTSDTQKLQQRMDNLYINPLYKPNDNQAQDATMYNPYKPVEPNTQASLPVESLNTTGALFQSSANTTQTNTSTAQENTSSDIYTPGGAPTEAEIPSKGETAGSANEIEGTMTLEQSWHPYLADKSSPVYKILERGVVTAIKNVYAQVNDEVTPTILGFSETNIPASSVSVTTEKKVAVRFKVTFLSSEKASSKPLEDAVSAKSVAGILIYQNSLVIAASLTNTEQNGTKNAEKTICQKQQKMAESESDGVPVGGFTPQCKPDGSYKSVQCHALTGFCWCVNKAGVRISGTEERYKQPNCEGIKISGNVQLPQSANKVVLPGSCLTVFIQEMISCGSDINCHIPVIANETIRNVIVRNNSIPYELTTTKLKQGRYVITAVVNNGWCRVNSLKSKEMIRTGDFHTTTMHDIVIEAKTKSILKDITLEVLQPQETGIKLHGKVLLPADEQLTTIPEGSCLSIQTKLLKLCTGPKCPTTPTSGNETIKGLAVVNNTVPYDIQLPELEPGTYVISAVLHIGQCPESDQTMTPGDYYNDEMVDYIIAMETTDVEKDINVVKLNKQVTSSIYVSGRVLFPTNEPIPPESCLTISSRKLIQCRNNNCKIPPVSTRTFENVTNEGGIPYSLLLPVATPGKYIISAVVNLGWCKTEGGSKWIQQGDYYNDKVHDFEIKNETTSVGKNIKVMPFETEVEKTGVMVHGRVILPPSTNGDFPSNSCLTVKAQEFKLCGGTINCVNPISGKQTFSEPKIEDNVIPYALVLPNVASGHYIISAVFNVGWCKETDPPTEEWIRNGDYHNEETNDFVIESNDVEKDVEVVQYFETVTAPVPSVEAYRPSIRPPTTPSITYPNKPAEVPIAPVNQETNTNTATLNISQDSSNSFNGKQIDNNLNTSENRVPKISENTDITAGKATGLNMEIKTTQAVPSFKAYRFSTKPATKPLITDPPITYPNIPTETSSPKQKNTINTTTINNTSANNYPAKDLNGNTAAGNTGDVVMTTTTKNVPGYVMTSTVPPSVSEASVTSTVPANIVSSTMRPMVVEKFATTPQIGPVSSSTIPTLAQSTVSVKNVGGTYGESSGGQPLINNDKKNNTEEIITLPAGLPKSCQEIREAGIGNMDGQYIIEARPKCHLSIICQGMERARPKEFLGGPSEDEWKYWHYAVLITISDQAKRNIPAGACLENTASGKNLIKRVLIAGGKQDNPISEWKTNIAKLLRSKRDIAQGDTLITKAKKIYKDKTESNLMLDSEWGVL
ncbi:uncharacterized protein LOC130655955 [Hydractinia symbiolongicarpus]|uniref:uncharacterized protein LOC130655955 n=1 Tax=Hydractinia symbiolongicarpus TaxID=13093 RepID=UPI002550F586|nr:uncharacterized protein LOC130655955 [Hydractinia symbiolongicarpus]XP_057314763.1 uncharacterized protein LOC130655955 [Hydractinia symbiolongicarpus]